MNIDHVTFGSQSLSAAINKQKGGKQFFFTLHSNCFADYIICNDFIYLIRKM